LHSEVYEEIEHVADKLKVVDGVVGVVLFGSYSRGDYDEGSDVDLLVVFNDGNALHKGREEVYLTTSQSAPFFQAVCLTVDELKGSPLLGSAMREARIYYANEDVKKLLTPSHRPYALITYSTANLNAKERVLFTQKLEGRGKGKYKYEGLVRELDGFKVGRGVMMIPTENLKTITQHLEKKGINYVIRHIWA